MSQQTGGGGDTDAESIYSTARYMAEQLSIGFRAHDKGLREEAVEAFHAVDRLQFQNLDEEDTHLTATAFVDSLWAKDEVEFQCLRNGELQAAAVESADYGPVKQKLRQRASVIGADSEYALKKAEAWRKHKSGGDYWTPFGESQMHELRAALRNPTYPDKPRAGQSGPGPEPLRYVLAFELHDMHTEQSWREGIEVMVPYYATILRSYEDDAN